MPTLLELSRRRRSPSRASRTVLLNADPTGERMSTLPDLNRYPPEIEEELPFSLSNFSFLWEVQI